MENANLFFFITECLILLTSGYEMHYFDSAFKPDADRSEKY